jgi:hypothetical protein
LHNRSYHDTTGRRPSRDPIGYEGGPNLYEYCEGDPVNEADPEGLRALYAYDRSALRNLDGAVGRFKVDANLVKGAHLRIGNAIAASKSAAADPPGLKVALWGLNHLGDSRYGFMGSLPASGVGAVGPKSWKCNRLVADAYAVGAGLWYGSSFPRMRGTQWPYTANDLVNPRLRMRHLRVVSSPKVGDVVALKAPGGPGHSTLNLGGGMLLPYAGPDGVKVGTFEGVYEGHVSYVFRHYVP